MRKASLVTIFIPVYNGEKYLHMTLNSIKNQTYNNLEVLIVDDASTDSSLSVLKTYEREDKRFKVIEKENSGMVPKIINYIKHFITGDFFFYVSQDDILSLDLVENMVNRQRETDADTVLPDMEFYYEQASNNKKIIGFNGNRLAVLKGIDAFKASLNWNIHGFALFRSQFVKEAFYPEDAFDSDEYITRKLFLKSNKVVFCKGTFFYRQDNSNAITKVFALRNFYQLNTLIKTYNLMKENGVDKAILVNAQYNLLNKHHKSLKQVKTFNFKSNDDKITVIKFLNQFKKDNFTFRFLKENILFALKNVKFRFLILAFYYKLFV